MTDDDMPRHGETPVNRGAGRRPPPFWVRCSRSAIVIAGTLSFLLLGGCFVTNSAPKAAAAKVSGETESLVKGAPTAPVLKIRFTPKQLIFSWDKVADASHYRLLEDDGSGNGFRPLGGEIISTSYRREIHFRPQGWRKNRYLLEACNSYDCSSSKELFIGDQIQPIIGRVESPTPDLSDYFGIVVALSADGSTLAVSAPGEDGKGEEPADNSLREAGAVYIFNYDPNQGKWIFQSYLKAAPATESGRFGSALALSSDGNLLAVGASLEAGGGAVYLFTRTGKEGEWARQAILKPAPVDGERRFGFSLALSNDASTLVVGAPTEQSASAGNETELLGAGAIYLYAREGNEWHLRSRLEPNKPVTMARFGQAVAIDQTGTQVAVGAETWSATPEQEGEGEGAVFLFALDQAGKSWSQQALIQPELLHKGSRFGESVVISRDGNTLAVGASRESGGEGIPHAGAVYLFRKLEGRWRQQHRIQAHNRGAHDEFGTALAFNQDASLLAVGAPFEDSSTLGVNEAQRDETSSNSGAVYLYALTPEKWRQLAYIKPTTDRVEERSYGEFGTTISLSNDSTILAVGAPHLASRLLLTGEILETLNAPSGTGLLYLYSPPLMVM